MQSNFGESSWNDYDANDEWIECNQCRYPMLPLRSFEIQKIAEFPAVEADGVTFLIWGWTIFVAQIISRFLAGLITFGARKKKLAQAKAEILPRFPNSLICPQCLATVKRR